MRLGLYLFVSVFEVYLECQSQIWSRDGAAASRVHRGARALGDPSQTESFELRSWLMLFNGGGQLLNTFI